MDKNYKFLLLLIAHLLLYSAAASGATAVPAVPVHGRGQWQLLMENVGVVAMHMTLTPHNTVVMFDQLGSGGYHLRRRHRGRRCGKQREDAFDPSCYAHSIEYDVASNKIRPLHVVADTWCSSGSMLTNGTLMQTGGYADGARMIRYFKPCGDRRCDWRQGKQQLSDDRWYASNLRLPMKNDTVIVVGGRGVFSYEFVPKRSPNEGVYELPLLQSTYDRREGGSNLYPMLHLSSDGHLFIFANRDSILFDYKRNRVVKTYPRIPGKGSRSYPSTGSSVILPLSHTNGFRTVEVMICGGAAPGAFSAAKQGRFLKGLSSCGRMVITGNTHRWKMETMPAARLMNDMIMLPTGNVLIINGVKHGCAGWNSATYPSYHPYLYKPKKVAGRRFTVLRASSIARMYHSSALLLPDGRILVAGSNPNNRYVYRNVVHPTELRLEAFVPPHMARNFDDVRPHNVSVYANGNDEAVAYGEDFSVKFVLGKKDDEKKTRVAGSNVVFTAYAVPFHTHSISMNQRLLMLRCKHMVRTADGWMNALVAAPPSQTVAPAGYYLLTVVNDGIPSRSLWIKFVHG
ncbi:aldehyde oxidase GLOX-like [Andrographis paniculata]|uniref:aldehyde oxidase GLOX-like n=1 Tax=Andrographis paniculata TaxID=175694 RepID=UPI0021E8860F|nr:aldehyde oxidase GLOX-like [Andrographis paniculata]